MQLFTLSLSTNFLFLFLNNSQVFVCFVSGIKIMNFIQTAVCHAEEMKMTAEWQDRVPQRQQ